MENAPRHGKVLADLVQRCMREGRLAKLHRGTAMSLLMGGITFPVIMVEGAKAMAPRLPFKVSEKMVEQMMLSDEAIRTRVDLLLKALKP